ncbi:hypothetical protein N7475_000880 [Penicillium sp. IBT 31633x]|nr:hypothetical protein N7475_000880 [Penicillium sp. IBT 31633x]
MASLCLDLVVPSTHHIDNQRHEQGPVVAPLSGHIVLSTTSLLSPINVAHIHARLIQIVTYTINGQSARRLSRSLFCSPSNKLAQSSSKTERVIRDISLAIPSKESLKNCPGPILSKSCFSFNIPTNIPATTDTPLGTVTYVIEATTLTSNHHSITQRQPVTLNRQIVQDNPRETQHHLSFPNSHDIHGMTLSQESTPRSGPKISFTAMLHTNWETASTDRPTELRHLVVRELRWQAEEIVKVMSKPNGSNEKYSICEQRSVRRLCSGSEKGYWGSDRNPYVKRSQKQHVWGEAGEKPAIRISFNFMIPKRGMVRDAVDLAQYEICEPGHSPNYGPFGKSCFSSPDTIARVITIHHQLKIEFVTGEDVFNEDTGKLVDRTRLRTVLCPAIPLHVCEVST